MVRGSRITAPNSRTALCTAARAQNEILSSYAEKSSSGKAKKSQLSQIKGNSWRTRFFVLVGGPMPRVRYFGTKDDCGRNTRRIS